MAAEPYRPAMSDLAVIAKTGRSWDQWFVALDDAGAANLDHRAIARLLGEKYRVGPWWRQMVTVEYERARGLRAKHQTPAGFSVSISKTLVTDVSTLFAVVADSRRRAMWFPAGDLKISSQTENKYFRGSWNGTTRMEIGFVGKPGGKAQIAVQIGKLAEKSDVERERAAWKAALAKLEPLLRA